MNLVTEKFLSFLWKYRLFDSDSVYLDGDKIEIVDPGEMNSDSGPDFFNARIKIGSTLWVGNVEIHVKASDWNRHGHDHNPAFSNVILHLVDDADMPVFTSKGELVPTICLAFDRGILEKYDHLMEQELWIPCENQLNSIDDLIFTSWMTQLGVARLESHTGDFLASMESTTNNWEEALYRQLAKSFGFHINAQPFEALALSVPFKILRKYRNDALQLEALLFGQAGLLNDDYSVDPYQNQLKTEYHFLRKKHSLKPIETHLWKFMRIRPGNFPTIRIAQFAAFIHQNPSFFSLLLEMDALADLRRLFRIEVSSYWLTHYTFGNTTRKIAKPMGEESAKVILINTIMPFYFVYGKMHGAPEFQDRALRFLEMMSPEKNTVTDHWKQLGIQVKHAFDSQALLELKNEYCDKKRCLDCGIGVKLISSK